MSDLPQSNSYFSRSATLNLSERTVISLAQYFQALEVVLGQLGGGQERAELLHRWENSLKVFRQKQQEIDACGKSEENRACISLVALKEMLEDALSSYRNMVHGNRRYT